MKREVKTYNKWCDNNTLRVFKKMIVFILFIMAIVILNVISFVIISIDHGYMSGRDTIAFFDDGRFQLVKFDAPDIKLIGLYDAKEEKMIENTVYFWRKVDDKVYFIIEDGYGVLDLATGNYKESSSLTDFDIEDQYTLGGLYIMKE